jgi:hypothetical protein
MLRYKKKEVYMKPNIMRWTYFALGILILTNTANILLHPLFIFRYGAYFEPVLPTIIINGRVINSSEIMTNDVDVWSYLFPPFIIALSSIVTFIGLIKTAPWSRVTAYIVIGAAAIEGIGYKLYFVAIGEDTIIDLLHTFIIVDLLFLFFAFKLYSSEPLKTYFSSASRQSENKG